MKNFKLITLLTFLMTNLLVLGYLKPLGDMSAGEVKRDVKQRVERQRIAEIEKNIDAERSPRSGQWVIEEEPAEARLIMYLDPAVGYGAREEYELVEAVEYKYPDGSKSIISAEGEVLKDR